ncbi:hypothetical protein A2V49_01615 [candidate division WWE3 bacterium RBG_19FT_COMBO_34_6]|uniref:DUF1189 domain-containing protein n=1 Tax=candidate division WWE3 bacterium RBG_19FT_COMBO_34_6 TaxID=1802612 RepID=A0A1F4UK08_UNCKA|nr:MAG: hypothetical protein A2V49_01615 [candidate division WWE3 bacterium RBG_19FT_COMBO_34_6]
MKRLKALFYVYKNSLISIKYYRDLKDVRIKFSVKYFLVLAFAAVIISSINTAYHLIPKINMYAEKFLTEVSDLYPQDLEIKSSTGKWEINKPEPYSIPLPKSMQYESGDFKMPVNLIVFSHNGTINDLKDLDTLILVNDTNIITRDERGKIEAYPLDSIPDGKVTRYQIDSLLSQLQKFINKIPVFIFILILIGGSFYYFLFRMLYLAVFALILMLIGNIKKLDVNYGMYFRVSTHSATLPITLEVLANVLGIGTGFGLGFFVIHIIFATIVVINLSSQEKVVEPKDNVPTQI